MLAKERSGLKNLVVAGGPCACNAEPLCDFVDLFMLGEGEEVMHELMDLYKACLLYTSRISQTTPGEKRKPERKIPKAATTVWSFRRFNWLNANNFN